VLHLLVEPKKTDLLSRFYLSLKAKVMALFTYPQARKFMKVRLGFIQNNRSSAPPIVMMDGEASVGYL